MASKQIIEITAADMFQKEVLQSEIPVLVDFWAPWCGPCRMIAPIIEDLAEELSDTVKVCKINVDEQQDIAMQYRVMTIPTVAIFRDGEVMDKLIGVQPKSDFLKMMTNML